MENERKILFPFEIIGILASIATILSFLYTVIRYIVNDFFQSERVRYFSIPADFFLLI